MARRLILALLVLFAAARGLRAETGADAWLRYVPVDEAHAVAYRHAITSVLVSGTSPTLDIIRREVARAGQGLLGASPRSADAVDADGAVVIGTPASSPIIAKLGWQAALARAGAEGYVIRSTRIGTRAATVIASEGEVGALYGTFHFLRLLQ